MKIKNIKAYRTLYKSTRPVAANLDEHFVGNYHKDAKTKKKTYGWFTMYHGDKDGYTSPQGGIENFLQSFLDMAKDGQAVYEFLQNAVDAGSTHFTMVWDKDPIDGNYYLLVANNGQMFSLNAVRSILNVGSSTKTADSRTIGKFGIGFKLAHRLVGKNNGLEELINENSGPILFSWKNYDLIKLSEKNNPIPETIVAEENENGDLISNDESPWLFKILITCFPCLVENPLVADLPRMVNGEMATSSPFSKQEYDTLARWVKNYKSILSADVYKEGSIFFLKLGSGKESELNEINLKEGVKFALAILKETADSKENQSRTLETVQLNAEEPITFPDLQYIKIGISKTLEKDTYAYIRFGVSKYEELTEEQIRKSNEEADIENLFGFRKCNEIKDYFKGAPNLYLYFPLSEEVHNFNYILHSNAFYKGSSRTFLHKGSTKEDGINERLLKTLVGKIDDILNELSTSKSSAERSLFLDFYAALLTSEKSNNHDRLWIEEPYSNPIKKVLAKYIPVKASSQADDFYILDDPSKVFVLKTKVDINVAEWNLQNTHWFYWQGQHDWLMQTSAEQKLGIKNYTVFDLLNEKGDIFSPINKWLNKDERKIEIILEELEPQVANDKNTVKLRENLFKLHLLRFNNLETLSLGEFQDVENTGYFILHSTLFPEKGLFDKLNLIHSVNELDKFGFIRAYGQYMTGTTQLRNYTFLTQLFSLIVQDDKLRTLSQQERLKIFNAFRTLNETPVERIKELKLFSNNAGRFVCFKNLFLTSDIKWLKMFCIRASENDSSIKNYLCSDTEDLYEFIIFPFWGEILEYCSNKNSEAAQILSDVTNAFEESKWKDKNDHCLSKWKTILFKRQAIQSDYIYFNTGLAGLDDELYHDIQNATFEYFSCHIPDKILIESMAKAPYLYQSCAISEFKLEGVISISKIKEILTAAQIVKFDFFEKYRIAYSNGELLVIEDSAAPQAVTDSIVVRSYLDKFYKDGYHLLPDELNAFSSQVELSGSELIIHLIERFTEDESPAQEIDLIELTLAERYDIKRSLFEKLTYIVMDGSWQNTRQNEIYLKLLREIIEGVENSAKDFFINIHNKLKIQTDAHEIVVADIDSADDAVKIEIQTKSFVISQSKLLNLKGAENISMIRHFHDEALLRGLLSPAQAANLFKISNSGISKDLADRFVKTLQDKRLTNSDQLAFVLFSGQFSEVEMGSFSALSSDGVYYDVEKQLILHSDENVEFIDPKYLLDVSYNELKNLLGFSDFEALSFGEAEESILLPRFLFIRGCVPKILLTGVPVAKMLDYLLKGHTFLNLTKVSKSNMDWEAILGFEPTHFLLSPTQLPSEVLLQDIIQWHQNDGKKIDLLKDIGVQGAGSDVVALRNWFLSPQSEKRIDESQWERINYTLLKNTLIGLETGFADRPNARPVFDLIQQAHYVSVLEQLIVRLNKTTIKGIPALVYNSNTTVRIASDPTSCFMIDVDIHDRLRNDPSNNLQELYSRLNIVRHSPAFHEIYSDEPFQPLICSRMFVEDPNANEHDEPFYRSWKEEHLIQLVRVSEVRFRLTYVVEENTIELGTIPIGDYHIVQEQEIAKLFYNNILSLEELVLKIEDQEFEDAIHDLIKRKNTMLTSFYNTLNSAGKDEFNSAHLQALESAFREENLKQERKELIENIQESEKYSFNWFESYLKYLGTFESRASTTQQQTLTFQKIQTYAINDHISDKFLMLRGCGSIIPLNIENFEDFKVTLVIRNQQNENIIVEGAQKKGQDLLVYSREPISPKVISKLNNVIQVKISFTPVIDLLHRLTNSFLKLDPWDNIQQALPPLHYIYGPPGTGKTTKLCHLIADLVDADMNVRILFLTPTNKAADVLCKKILLSSSNPSDTLTQKLQKIRNSGNDISLCRIGKPTDPELEQLQADLYRDSITTADLDLINVVASTVHRIPYYDLKDEENQRTVALYKLDQHWDYVVFDEASMINLPYLVFAIQGICKTNPAVKFVIAGDPKQIPPVVDVSDYDLEQLDIQDENVYRMLNINSFRSSEQMLRNGDSIDNLDTQYRSVSQIGHLFSNLSYSDLLKHHREKDNSRPLPIEYQKILTGNVTFIDIPVNNEDSVFRINRLLFSSYHTYSAILVTEMIKKLGSCINEKEQWTVGLISPYKAQAILLNKIITSFGISERIKVYADTVHGFQGDECDIIFFVCNPNNYRYTGHSKSLLSKEYIYNVAISRAKDYLVVLHPYSSITENTYINKISSAYGNKFGNPVIRTSSAIEKLIFGQSDFIEKNSFLTGHDNVNVFGQEQMQYFIKFNDSAIDIKLK